MQSVVVTGVSTGIGWATAKLLLDRGIFGIRQRAPALYPACAVRGVRAAAIAISRNAMTASSGTRNMA
jgi:NAD(P)-dependent dehydrogenase (short-subunit alcohol dehydrogenase family)